MVNAAKNSPAVVLWSIGNEIPDSTSATVGLPIAKRLVADIKAIDTTRPIVIGSDKYRSVPATGSGADLILGQLDGLGLNYNTAASVDALHAKYPNTFLFESESSSETSTRGVYQDPDQLNTGENYTPGKRATSSYDNNLASWTMSGEYGLKKDRDRKYFQGQFLWSGTDYIGEPTPYNVFPVKSSFFGAVDTAGFPKDAYWLFRSQWTKDPMVHLLPMNWTDHEPGEPVQVWAYANVDTVELFLNGHSLGVRRFDHKTTVDGRPYLETTEATGDDKTVTVGPVPGQLHEPQRQRRQAAPDLGRALRARQARRRRQPRRPPGRPRRGRHRRAARGRQAHARQAHHRRRRALAVLLHDRRGRRPRRARPRRGQRDLLRRPRRRAPRRARQRPRGGRRELQGLDAPGVQRQGAGHRRLRRPARADHGDRDRRRPRAGALDDLRRARARGDGAPSGPGARLRGRRPRERPARPADRPDRRRELLGQARHAAGGHDRRRSGHGVVELLPQGRDRAAAVVQPRAPARVGLGRVARRAVGLERPRGLHDRRHPRAAGRHRRALLGRHALGRR